jgi:membrane associated rhomboid family serine protease
MSDPFVPIFQSVAAGPCFEQALVLEARGFDYELRSEGLILQLAVPPADAARARQELEHYRTENVPLPAAPGLPISGGGGVGAIAYVVALLAITWFDDRALFGHDWFEAGKVDGVLIRAGEWWRPFTALTLHADAAHLFGNLVFGVLFGYAAGQLLGSGVAWFSILIAGALGNAVNTFIQAPEHTSVGASTAVFAALGIVSAFVWRLQRRFGRQWPQRWAALIVGGVLLTLLGIGDEHTDIVAHLAGFLSGVAAGWAWGMLGHRVLEDSLQRVLGFVTAVILAVAWAAALNG